MIRMTNGREARPTFAGGSLETPDDVRFWCEELHTDEEALRDAVKQVGTTMETVVRRYLTRDSGLSSSSQKKPTDTPGQEGERSG